jgi:acylphosphatase
MIRAHILVQGRVQGVGFRQFTCRVAVELGLTGWVRNLPDGRVEIVAEGEDLPLTSFMSLIRQGPPLSRVDAISATNTELTERESIAFEFRR